MSKPIDARLVNKHSKNFPHVMYREIFAALPAIDNRYADMSQIERNTDVAKIYQNTKKALELGIDIPVKEDHEGGSRLKHGQLVNVKLVQADKPYPHYVVQGKIELDDEFYKHYKTEKLPALSVETVPYGNIESYTGVPNDQLGTYIMAVSMCGSSPVAFPSLKTSEVQKFTNMYNIHHNRFVEPLYNSTQKDSFMKKKFMEMLKALSTMLEKMLPDDEETALDESITNPEQTPKPGFEEPEEVEEDMKSNAKCETPKKKMEETMDDKKQDMEYTQQEKDKRIAELEKQVKELQAFNLENEYANLAAKGYILPEHKDLFLHIAQTSGLEIAKKVYNREIVPVHEVLDNPIRDKNEMGFDTEQEKSKYEMFKSQFARRGYENEQLEKMARKAAKNVLTRMSA